TVKTVYQFPLPTWIENIAVRSTGQLVVSLLTTPELYLIDPYARPPMATLIHSFVGSNDTGLTGLLGIAELSHDVFALVAGQVPTTAATPGNYSIWIADLRPQGMTGDDDDDGKSKESVVRKVADIPAAELLNGLAAVNETTLLIADSMKGVVWKLDVETRRSVVLLDDESLKPGRDAHGNFIKAGVNGLRVHGGYMYFSNSATGVLSRIQLDCEKAVVVVVGSVESVARDMVDADDFAVGNDGRVFVARN
ncbi:hypothetical protein K504DRAFT_336578, partial [Pleomassaria siparia CBS 279.74]